MGWERWFTPKPEAPHHWLQDKTLNQGAGSSSGVSRLNNMLMQMRKVGAGDRTSFMPVSLAASFCHPLPPACMQMRILRIARDLLWLQSPSWATQEPRAVTFSRLPPCVAEVKI